MAMAKALIILISNLLPELLANAKVILSLLKPAGAVAAFFNHCGINFIGNFFIWISVNFHNIVLFLGIS